MHGIMGINVLYRNKWGTSLRVKPFTEHNGSCVSKPVIYFDQKLHKATLKKRFNFLHFWPEINPDFYHTPYVTSNIGYIANC